MSNPAPVRNPATITSDTYLSSHEVGKMLQVNPSSVNKWTKEGRITAHRTPGGHRRFKAADIVAFLWKHEMPVPAALQVVVVPPVAAPAKAAVKKSSKKRK